MYREDMIHELSVSCFVPWSKVLRYTVALCIVTLIPHIILDLTLKNQCTSMDDKQPPPQMYTTQVRLDGRWCVDLKLVTNITYVTKCRYIYCRDMYFHSRQRNIVWIRVKYWTLMFFRSCRHGSMRFCVREVSNWNVTSRNPCLMALPCHC